MIIMIINKIKYLRGDDIIFDDNEVIIDVGIKLDLVLMSIYLIIFQLILFI